MDTSDPQISFDKDGISNHYWDYHNYIKQNWYQGETGSNKLSSIVEKLKIPPLSKEEVKEEFNYISDKLVISIDELEAYKTMEKKYYWNYANNRFIFKIGETILKKIAKTRRGGAY